MGLLSQSKRKWEKSFRRQIEPQLRLHAPQLVAHLRDKSRGAAHNHMVDAVRILAEHGYILVQSDLQPLSSGFGMAVGWGTLVFERSRQGANA